MYFSSCGGVDGVVVECTVGDFGSDMSWFNF